MQLHLHTHLAFLQSVTNQIDSLHGMRHHDKVLFAITRQQDQNNLYQQDHMQIYKEVDIRIEQ